MAIKGKKAAEEKQGEVPGTALLSKALNILECIADSDGRLRSRDIAQLTGYAKPTLYRILAALSARGFVQVDPRDHAHSLGPRFTEMAGTIAQHSDLISVASLHLKKLAEKYGEVVTMGVLSGTSQQAVAQVGSSGVGGTSSIGARKPLYCTAAGKALLAAFDPATRKKLLSKTTFEPLTKNTITDERALEADLAAIQLRGFAMDREEIVEGTKCVGVSVVNAEGVPFAAISVSGPVHRMTDARLQEIAVDLGHAARAIKAAMSGGGTDSRDSVAGLNWLDVVQDLSAFSIDGLQVLPDGRVLACDGPGGAISRVGDMVERIFFKNEPIHAMCLFEGVLIVACGASLYRVDPQADAGAEAVKLFESDAIAEIDAMTAVGGTLYCGSGETVIQMDLSGGRRPVAANRIANTGLKFCNGRPTFATREGLVQFDPVQSTQSILCRAQTDDIRDFACGDDETIWVVRTGGWAVEQLNLDGTLVRRIPLPVSKPSALLLADHLYVGSERWTLSSAQLDVAPASGSLFTIMTEKIPVQ